MTKNKLPAQLLLAPVPAAMIGCGNGDINNIITLAWVGVVNSNPPFLSIAVRPNRYSHNLIRDSGEFTVNLPSVDQVAEVDGCGTISGRDTNKFEHFGLTAVRSTLSCAPLIEECPVSMECLVEQTLSLGSHTLFIGRVIASYVADCVTDARGKIDFGKARLLGFCSGNYLETAPLNLTLGYTLEKDN
ncbi:MAG: flavin reductase family protein [Bacillota bacterium]|nr:flavin reductase family protein [Bacillota bacterium]